MKRTDSSTRAHLFRRLDWEELDRRFLRRLIDVAREEDLAGAGLSAPPAPERGMDVTSAAISSARNASARLTARESLRVCGLHLAPMVLDAYGGGVDLELLTADGMAVDAGATLARLRGPAKVMLESERVMLNFLQHLSGIASETARHADALAGSPTRLLDTRKTTPGWRMLEKYAVAKGGGWNHRLGLFDRVMLKDNHLAAEGAGAGERLATAVRNARTKQPDLVVEVEVDALEQIPPVLEAGVDVVLLDNFQLSDLEKAVRMIGGLAYTEASGGVTFENLPLLGHIGLDFISCGAITHQSRWKDIALDWEDSR